MFAGTRLMRRVRDTLKPPALILYYHRVARLDVDPFQQAISPELFKQHLEVICQYAHPISLDCLVRSLPSGRLPCPRLVVVTFDDGYADNLYQAQPLLEKYGVPATFFIASGYMGGQREFWWDELEKILLLPKTLPTDLELCLAGKTRRWTVANASADAAPELGRSSATGKSANPVSRDDVFKSVHSLIRPLPCRDQERVVEQLCAWGGIPRAVRPSHRLLTHEELNRLGQGELFEIEADTLTHASLPDLPEPEQRAEITGGKEVLERILGRDVRHFSYPYGACNASCAEVVRSSGLHSGASVRPALVRQGTDKYSLPRYWAKAWTGEQFERILSECFAS